MNPKRHYSKVSGLSYHARVLRWLLFLAIFLGSASAERAYPQGCSNEPTSYYDYNKNVFPPAGLTLKTVDNYMIVQRLGTGKFSDVFEAVDVGLEKELKNATSSAASSAPTFVDPRSVVVLKCLKPVSERKVRREILILQHASKLPNLARIKALVLPTKNEQGETMGVPTLVLQHAGPECRWLSHYGGGSTNLASSAGFDKTLAHKIQGRGSVVGENGDDDDDDTALSDYEIRYACYNCLQSSSHQSSNLTPCLFYKHVGITCFIYLLRWITCIEKESCIVTSSHATA